jgi:hypothetical protein
LLTEIEAILQSIQTLLDNGNATQIPPPLSVPASGAPAPALPAGFAPGPLPPAPALPPLGVNNLQQIKCIGEFNCPLP